MSNKKKRLSLIISGGVMILVGVFFGHPVLNIAVPIVGFAMTALGLVFIKPEV